MNKSITALLLACQLPLGTAYAMDFLAVYELAEQNDPEIMAASFQYQAKLETRDQSSSVLLPQIDIDVFSQQVRNTTNSPFSLGDYDATGYTISLTQSIYNHDQYLRLEQTDLNIAAAAAEYAVAQQALVLRVAQAYFDVLAAEDNLAFAEAEKKAIGEQLQQTQKRYDVGLIAITDVKESQAQFDLSVAQQIRASNQLAVSRETLRSIIDQLPPSLSRLSDELPLAVPEPQDMEAWVQSVADNNLALKAADFALDIAAKQVSIDRSGHYPTLNLNLTHDDVETDASTTIEAEDTSLTLNLNIPVYSGGQTSAATRQAIAEQQQARFERDRVWREVSKLARDSYLGVNASIAEVEATRQALLSSQAAFEATQAGFDAGTRTAVEVLSVLREQYRAERNYAQARYDYVINVLQLKQAAGLLSKQDVELVNSWLQ